MPKENQNSQPTEYLYLDNFRGFDDTYIPLREITFFVGENSTGKSSAMSMLNLVRNFSFWFDPDFDTDDQHLGGFNDLVSTGSTRQQFTIGSARPQATFSEERRPFVVFATFSNRDGLPYISKLSFLRKTNLTTIFEIGKDIFYLRTPFENTPDISQFNQEWLTNLVRQHNETNGENSKKFDLKGFGSGSGIPLFHMLSLIDQFDRPKKNKSSTNPKESDISEIYQFILPPTSSVWLAPIRTKPKRTYDGTKKAFSSEGDHTPYLLKKQLSKKSAANKFHKIVSALGRDSHLFDDILIKSFGAGDSAPFEVQVNLDGVVLGISNVGYGVSQVLPILAEIVARNSSCVFHIQQPEVHLHPRAQAALGDLFYTLAVDQKKKFVIETHSDFLIDRFRLAMDSNKTSDCTMSASVVFFCRKSKRNTVSELLLTESGGYPIDQPDEFRDFFIHEQLRNLSI